MEEIAKVSFRDLALGFVAGGIVVGAILIIRGLIIRQRERVALQKTRGGQGKVTVLLQSPWVDCDPAIVYSGDLLRWDIESGHTFQVDFKNGEKPFTDPTNSSKDKGHFTQKDNAGKAKEPPGLFLNPGTSKYYGYTLTVDNNPPIDPGVVIMK